MSEPHSKYQFWTPEIEQRYLRDALEHHGVVTMVNDVERGLVAAESPTIGPMKFMCDDWRRLLPGTIQRNGDANGNGHAQTYGKPNGRFQASEERRMRPRFRPYYCAERHELWFGNILVKRLTACATNQHAALTAWQRLDWRRRLPLPLPRRGDREQYRQLLKDLVDALNDSMINRVLRFRRDGSGFGIRWHALVVGVATL